MEAFMKGAAPTIIDRISADGILMKLWITEILTWDEIKEVDNLKSKANRNKFVEKLYHKDFSIVEQFINIVAEEEAGKDDAIESLREAQRKAQERLEKNARIQEEIKNSKFHVNPELKKFILESVEKQEPTSSTSKSAKAYKAQPGAVKDKLVIIEIKLNNYKLDLLNEKWKSRSEFNEYQTNLSNSLVEELLCFIGKNEEGLSFRKQLLAEMTREMNELSQQYPPKIEQQDSGSSPSDNDLDDQNCEDSLIIDKIPVRINAKANKVSLIIASMQQQEDTGNIYSSNLRNYEATLVIHFTRSSTISCALIRKCPLSKTSKFIHKSTIELKKTLSFEDNYLQIGSEHIAENLFCDNGVLDLHTFLLGDTKKIQINGKKVKLEYEEALGLYFAKLRQQSEQEVHEQVKKCLIVVPTLSSIVAKEAVSNAVKCAGFSTRQIITESTAVAANSFTTCTPSPAESKYLLIIMILGPNNVLYTIYELTTEQPLIKFKGISGTYCKIDMPRWFWTAREQTYLDDILDQAKIDADKISKVIMVGDSLETYTLNLRGLKYTVSQSSSTMENVLDGAIWLALRNSNDKIPYELLSTECLPYQLLLKTPSNEPVLLFKKGTLLPAKTTEIIDFPASCYSATAHQLVPCDAIQPMYQVLPFDVIQQMSSSSVQVISKYNAEIKCASQNSNNISLLLEVEIDSNGLIQLNGILTELRPANLEPCEAKLEAVEFLNIKSSVEVQQRIQSWINSIIE